MEVQAMRKQFAALRAFSGVEAKEFAKLCECAFHEWMDGEWIGQEMTPEQWVRFAAEVAWEVGTRCGREKAKERELKAMCEKFWKGAA